MPRTHGAHHIGLAVHSAEDAARFFVDALGLDEVRRDKDYPAIFVSDGELLLTLWQVDDAKASAPFDRSKNVGLHHLALRVKPDDLDELHTSLAHRDDVVIEFAPEKLRSGPVQHMMIRGPSGLRIEFIAVP